MRKKVVVIGGGVAGMTAAHELIERGFEVTLCERKKHLGGKAASVDTEATGFPAEHGFRFFPGWYQHLPDTLQRIPYEVRYEKRTVYQNLVAAEKNLFASYYHDPVEALVRLPRSWDDLRTAASFLRALPSFGLTADDLTFFFTKLLLFAATPEAVRIRDYDSQTWWDFLEADTRTEAFQKYLVTGLTRNTVAAKPREASAYTIGQAVLRTLFDALRPVGLDRVLNGPTSEVWIEPWTEYLRAQGVKIYTEAELEWVEFDRDKIRAVNCIQYDAGRHETEARFEAIRLLLRLHAADIRKAGLSTEFLRGELGAHAIDLRATMSPEDLADAVLACWKVEFERGRGGDVASAALRMVDVDTRHVRSEIRDDRVQLDGYLRARYADARRDHEEKLAKRTALRLEGDYFVFALPVEQMAYYVNRSDAMRRGDSTIHNVIALSQHVDWMAGIQFYLTEKLGIAPGHIDCVDSEWHLTAISQAQFWPDIDLKERGKGDVSGKVKSILSVDISAWDVKGRLHRKEAFSCTRQEIAEEVWDQLKRSLNRPNRREILRDDSLLGSVGKGVPALSYSLDNDIADRFDRAKQGLYRAQESVRFSSEAIAERAAEADGKQALEQSFVFGERLEINVEPLLINHPGSLKLRPKARTNISNMFLASDYVRTNTNITTMEAANEAARSAVNEILRESRSHAKPCRIWQWQPSDVVQSLERLLQNRNAAEAIGSLAPLRLVTSAASAASGIASRALGRFVDLGGFGRRKGNDRNE